MPEINFILICLAILALNTGIQIFYYLYYFASISKKHLSLASPLKRSQRGVSVIICARNEISNLQEHLDHIIAQDYHEFEVIVVNDGSTDGSHDFLDEYSEGKANFRVLHLNIDDRFHRGKKFAQTIGIKAAKYEILLFTDADCKPISRDWISHMTSQYSNDQTEIILGLGHFERSRSFVNLLLQLETFHTMMMYISFAIKKSAYMGVGRNLSYTKSLFFKHKGFASHQHILSGDDDLFINEASTSTNTRVCIHPDAATVSIAPKRFNVWLKQKLRHYSTGSVYSTSNKLRIGIYLSSLFLMYLSFGLLVGVGSLNMVYIALSIFGLHFVVQAIILFIAMKNLSFIRYFWGFVFMDLGILLIHIFIGIRGYFSKPKTWN